jgi:hypothetical protein
MYTTRDKQEEGRFTKEDRDSHFWMMSDEFEGADSDILIESDTKEEKGDNWEC